MDYKNIHDMEEAELAKLVERHDRLYWQLGEPEISDDEYDALTRRLAELAPNHPVLAKIQTPAAASAGKIKHKQPMLSLDKAYSLEEILDWAKKHARSHDEKIIVQPKYDGISANYENGRLATRGDGFLGEDITDKIPLIEIEATGYKGPLANADQARGEIVIRNDDFKTIYSKIHKKNGETYKNPRNAVAGIVGLKKIDEMVRQGAKLTLVDYNLVSFTLKLRDLSEKWPEIVEEIESLPYPMDGIVLKLADAVYRESLGSTAHHPRGEIAFKFSGVRRTARLLDVEWSFGKNCLTPVAIIEPVDIGGATIQRASLHNIQNILDRDIHIGDTVTVERAGDVIPHIVDSEPGTEHRSCLISECPSCGTALERSGPEIKCPNPECPETRLARLLCAVKSLGIEGLGEPNVRRMMETLGVRSIKDILSLSREDILKLEGFKERSTDNLLDAISKAKRVADYQLMAALNIRGVGPNIAKKILETRSLDEIRTMDPEALAEIEGVGPERAKEICETLRSESDLLDELLDAVEAVETKNAAETARPTVCFTGKMPEKRSHYENLARDKGFEPVDSVTSKLSLLVAADPNAAGGKLAKAAKLGVDILPLDEWLALPAGDTDDGAGDGSDDDPSRNDTKPDDTTPPREETTRRSGIADAPSNQAEEGFLPGFE